MLKQRLLTAAILIPLVITGIFALPTRELALIFGLVIGLAAWEWITLVGVAERSKRVAYVALVLALLGVLWQVGALGAARGGILAGGCVVWLLVVGWMAMSPVQQLRRLEQRVGWRLAGGLLGVMILLPAWLAVLSLHAGSNLGPAHLLFLFVLIWAADSGAFLVGKRWGSRKLAPLISPGKTWEGVGGALVFAGITATLAGPVLGYQQFGLLAFVGLAALTVVISIYGDLLESVMKRACGVKDSGRLLPGHGGILDRIDSLLSGAPVFALGLLLLGNET